MRKEEKRAYNFLAKIHTTERDLRGENIPGRKPSQRRWNVTRSRGLKKGGNASLREWTRAGERSKGEDRQTLTGEHNGGGISAECILQ